MTKLFIFSILVFGLVCSNAQKHDENNQNGFRFLKGPKRIARALSIKVAPYSASVLSAKVGPVSAGRFFTSSKLAPYRASPVQYLAPPSPYRASTYKAVPLSFFDFFYPSPDSENEVETGDNRVQKVTNNGCLSLINEHRAKHGSPALEYDSEVEDYAAKRVTHLAEIDQMIHDDKQNPYGENLAGAFDFDTACEVAVKIWYDDEIGKYDYNNPVFGLETGHFTQVVWKSSTKLGCATSKADSGNLYTSCLFSPPGNLGGAFEKNVLPPQ